MSTISKDGTIIESPHSKYREHPQILRNSAQHILKNSVNEKINYSPVTQHKSLQEIYQNDDDAIINDFSSFNYKSYDIIPPNCSNDIGFRKPSISLNDSYYASSVTQHCIIPNPNPMPRDYSEIDKEYITPPATETPLFSVDSYSSSPRNINSRYSNYSRRNNSRNKQAFGRAETNSKRDVPDDINEKLVKNEKDQLYYSKKARPVDYKPITVAEYKSQKTDKYYELGSLPPDLDREDLIEKRNNLDKMKNYGTEMSKLNKEKLKLKPPKEKPPEKKEISKRERALEFAKNIPKPKSKPKSNPKSNKNAGKDSEQLESSESNTSENELIKLEKQHYQLENDIESIMKQYL